MEIWKDVFGYEGYYKVSSTGRVLSCTRRVPDARLGEKLLPERFLTPTRDSVGYLRVTLFKDAIRDVRKVHRLVAEHFCKKVDGADVVNHLDNNRVNNHADNLEWTTPLGNNQHMMLQGRNRNLRGEECWCTTLSEEDILTIRELCRSGKPQKEIGVMFGISQQEVSKINLKLRWAHVG